MTTDEDDFTPQAVPPAQESPDDLAMREAEAEANREAVVARRQPARLKAAAPDRTPPHSAEAEEHVIACCLLDGGDTPQRCHDEGLSEKSFYFPSNRLLYALIAERHAAKEPVSLEIVADELMKRRQLDAIGGMAHLMRITGGAPTTAHAGHFINEVRTHYQRRELIKLNTGAVEKAYAGIALTELISDTKDGIAEIEQAGGRADELAECEYDDAKIIKKPDAIYSIADTQVCTPGNMTTLYSQAKVGKTATVGAFIAAAMAPEGSVYDTLSISGTNKDGGALLHFDTEQSPYDRQQMIQTAMRRVGETKRPKWLKSYLLTGKSAAQCQLLVERAIRMAHKKFGKIFAVILDGTADLINDPNNPEEAFPLVTKIHGLAIDFNTTFINVLHLNPSATGPEAKGRGHLGSQLERKSESNLMLEKEGDVTRLYATKQRGKMITKDKSPSFKWDNEKGMHVGIGLTDARPEKKGSGGRPKTKFSDVMSIFPTTPERAATLAELVRITANKYPISKSALFSLINEHVEMGVLTRDETQPNRPKFWMSVPGAGKI